MKYLLPIFALVAGPALAHSTPIPHGHSADWMIVFGLGLIVAVALLARPRPLKVRK
jgi:hypothetical protein